MLVIISYLTSSGLAGCLIFFSPVADIHGVLTYSLPRLGGGRMLVMHIFDRQPSLATYLFFRIFVSINLAENSQPLFNCRPAETLCYMRFSETFHNIIFGWNTNSPYSFVPLQSPALTTILIILFQV